MAKKVTSEIIKSYCSFDEDNKGNCTILAQVKWNGREPKGYDIRKYDTESKNVYKGITISYDAFDKIILTAIEEGLVSIDKVKEKIKEFDDKCFSPDDFKKMFSKIDEEVHTYKRDKYGFLRDNDGRIVISKRIK